MKKNALDLCDDQSFFYANIDGIQTHNTPIHNIRSNFTYTLNPTEGRYGTYVIYLYM